MVPTTKLSMTVEMVLGRKAGATLMVVLTLQKRSVTSSRNNIVALSCRAGAAAA